MKKFNYKKRLWKTALAVLSIGALMGGCKDDFEQVLGICPEVESTNPDRDAVGITLNNDIIVTFNEAMNPASISSGVFSLKAVNGSATGRIADAARIQEEISGTLTFKEETKEMSFKPDAPLLPNTTYTGKVEPVVTDMMGNVLQAAYEWNFTTGVSPTVTSTNPANLATGVPLDQTITATFSMPMDSLTITTATYQLMAGTTAVSGEVIYADSTASFDPSNNLLAETKYTGIITIEAKNKDGIPMAMAYNWTFNTGMAPTVTSMDPLDLATGVPVNKSIKATFSEPMDPATITTASFKVNVGSTPVDGTVTYSDSTAVFTPEGGLLEKTTYSVIINSLAKNATGISLANDFETKFTTGNSSSPEVTTTDPANNATGVELDKAIMATFSQGMNSATITGSTFTVKQGNTAVAGTVSYSRMTATFSPTNLLSENLVYTGTITTGAKNTAGTALENDFVWTFTTAASIAPTVISTDPEDNATKVAQNKVVSATFSETMDPASINALTFTLEQSGDLVLGNVSYSGTTASFTPSSLLSPDLSYTATITTGAKNVEGTELANDFVWNFKIENPVSPYFVDLKTAERFGIFAATGVSNNAGFSVINDLDVGISPGVRTSVTGFPPAIVKNGAIFASDDTSPTGVPAMLTQSKLDLTEAYLYAEGATSPAPAAVEGDQGGKTLAPGIYKSNSTLLIQNGDLTLDAQGDPNAVWIFQVASGFTTVGGAGGNVILSGGAQAKNIFWQVGSSATIGDNTKFHGNVLAYTSITMNSGATIVGRLLVLNGAVVMTDTNIIERP